MQQQSFQQFVCLSGLPRTGSSLLSAILSQNPHIHAEGNSPVCPLMWEMCNSVTNCKEQFQANRKEHLVVEYIQHIPHFYYKGIQESIVVDKCRSWTHRPNFMMAKGCIDSNIKVIVMVRPIMEIVASFAKLYYRNGITGKSLETELQKLFIPDSDPLMRSLQGVKWAREQNAPGTFLFVNYDDLVKNPSVTIKRIYDFCGWVYFDHEFDNIQVKYPEDDTIYGMNGYHHVRRTLGKEETNIDRILTPEIIKKCRELSKELNNA